MMLNDGALDVSTPSDREVVVTRTFDAPRELVWRAMTEPELLGRWLTGPPGWTMTACEQDLKAGGSFRWVWAQPDGAELAMLGDHIEFEPPSRIVRTASYAMNGQAMPGEQTETMILDEQGGKTLLTLTLSYPSKEARDAAIASGATSGLAAGYAKLDELLATVA